MRFLNKAQKEKDDVTQEISTAADSDEELKNFKAQFRRDQSINPESQSEEEEDEEEERDEQEAEVKPGGPLCSTDEDDDEDLGLLTVKRKDVFNVGEDTDESEVNEIQPRLRPLCLLYRVSKTSGTNENLLRKIHKKHETVRSCLICKCENVECMPEVIFSLKSFHIP